MKTFTKRATIKSKSLGSSAGHAGRFGRADVRSQNFDGLKRAIERGVNFFWDQRPTLPRP